MSREKLFSLLGQRPESAISQSIQVNEEVTPDYVIETLLLELNGIESVPAYFIKPIEVNGKLPVVIYNHSHGGNYALGKEEVIKGNGYLQERPFAEELTRMGYGVLAIDAWGFGERSGKKESELFKEMLIRGRVLWGMMLYDTIHALDYLETRSDVDTQRLATIGMSMGGLMSWWLSAMDERIKVTVDIAAQVDLETLIEQRLLDKHGFYSYVPNLLSTFSTSTVQQLILPRNRLSLVGKDDPLCPIQGVEKLRDGIEKVCFEQNITGSFEQIVSTGGHQETAHMRSRWVPYIQKHL
ncbi:prolyl oligopeptidase family serine peptidase [Marinilactibacillus sp. XAAS-LB27]|uniref:dienelactone hydrolase family protein n=1 Tax=Marinilactibacillus sp. XAAS-LB27 TaxID=3114538 RepID=UPI002E17B830|nr:prolyl oligopeptidase family serine peptidase [Marinilactibacillus sp. XAAS-LB27]